MSIFGTLDNRTLNKGLNISLRLVDTGNVQGSLAILREVFAGATNADRPTAASDDLLFQVVRRVTPIAQPRLFAEGDLYSERLSSIIADLVADGFADEAVRVLVTAIGLNPRMGANLVAAARGSFGKPVVRSSASAVAIGRRLMDMGMQYLESGAADGIVLMSAAHRVGRIPLPVRDIGAAIEIIPDANANWTPVRKSDAQALTDYAYDLRRSGSLNTAVGVGMVIPPMLGDSSEPVMMDALASAAGGPDEAVVDVSRHFMAKGYVPQAGDLLMASDAVSAKGLWDALDRTVIKPSLQVDPPPVLRSFTRSVGAAISSVAAKAAEEPPDYKAFYFGLDGKDVRCDEAKWDAEFDLVFNYDSLPPWALVEIHGERFKVLMDSSATLEINIGPVGFMRRDRVAAQEVTFKDGKMQDGPVRFKLKAPAKNSGDYSKAGVWVAFSVNRNAIYKTFLSIKLVDELGSEPCKRRSLDLDLEEVVNGASRSRHAEVYMFSKGDSWEVFWNIKGDVKKPETTTLLTKSLLDAAYRDQRFNQDLIDISNKPVWNQVNEDLTLPIDDDNKSLAHYCIKRAMTAGSKLYDIFYVEPIFRELISKIEQLPDGSRIAFHTENTVFPWELIYPLEYDNGPEKNEDPKRFWGARFHIESLLMGEEKVLNDSRQPGKLRIRMGLNKSIDQEEQWKDTPPGPAERQMLYFQTLFEGRGDYFDTSDDIVQILKRADPASMIYFYCHGSSTELEFEDGKDPILAHSVSGDAYPGWPVVFINACYVGNIAPLSFISFRTKFRDKKAAGIIAPSFPIPTLFAAYFAKAVLTGYDERKPIGEIIFALRRQLLDQNNPLGLWYSIQCPLDVTAPEA